MTSEKLREIHQTRPFEPFVLHMADGTSIRVNHPEMMAISPTGRMAMVFDNDESSHYVDVFLIPRVEIVKSRRPGGGRRRAG